MVTSGYCCRNSGKIGATALIPKLMGTARRTNPRGATDWDSASFSAASPSASRRVARSDNFCPASVSASRREVRLNSRAPSRRSSRVTAFDTVALDSVSSAAAAANDRNSTTFAKIARPSKSGSFAIGALHYVKKRNNAFRLFLFLSWSEIHIQYPTEFNWKDLPDDRTQAIFKARQRRPRLAQGQAPLLFRRPLRSRQYGSWRVACVERRRDRTEHRISRARPRQHGNHHLCPRGRDHPPGQSWE